MNIHYIRNDIKKLIFEKLDLPFDLLKDDYGNVIDVVLRDKSVLVTWEGSESGVISGNVQFKVGETRCPSCGSYVEPGFFFRIIEDGVLKNTVCPKCGKDTNT